jgi:hypothetical protein
MSKPIIFGRDEVLAILDGRKTQTRRIVTEKCVDCRYGFIGDELWVKETWWKVDFSPIKLFYDADLTDGERKIARRDELTKVSPLFLSKKDSRITLKITDIRLQNLQDITDEDAKAEGCLESEYVGNIDGSPCYTFSFEILWTSIYGIDNPKAWDSNPLVWAISFERIKP